MEIGCDWEQKRPGRLEEGEGGVELMDPDRPGEDKKNAQQTKNIGGTVFITGSVLLQIPDKNN